MSPTPVPVVHLSQEGLQKAQAEHDRLLQYREEVLVRLQLAREMGDLSENGAYKAARSELGDTDRRLRKLKYLLRFGKVPPKSAAGIVGFGSHITLDHEGKSFTFQLVSEHESDPAQKKFSDASPLGQAVLGKKMNDSVTVHAPSGNLSYTITAVK